MAEALKGAVEKRGLVISYGGYLEAKVELSPTQQSKLDAIYAGKSNVY
jgi:hypothetical protein